MDQGRTKDLGSGTRDQGPGTDQEPSTKDQGLIQRVSALPMLRDVQPLILLLRIHPQPHRHVEDFEQHAGDRGRVDPGRHHRDELRAEERGVAEEEAVGAGGVDRFLREQAGHERAERAAGAVHAEDVQRVVDGGPRPQGDREEADRAVSATDEPCSACTKFVFRTEQVW